MEGTLWWKMTFYGTWPLMEDNLRWKTTFDGRRPSIEKALFWWKMTFDGRRPSMEDDLQWKTTVSGRRPKLERFRNSTLPYTAVAVIFKVTWTSRSCWTYWPCTFQPCRVFLNFQDFCFTQNHLDLILLRHNISFGTNNWRSSRSPFRRLTGTTIADR